VLKKIEKCENCKITGGRCFAYCCDVIESRQIQTERGKNKNDFSKKSSEKFDLCKVIK